MRNQGSAWVAELTEVLKLDRAPYIPKECGRELGRCI